MLDQNHTAESKLSLSVCPQSLIVTVGSSAPHRTDYTWDTSLCCVAIMTPTLADGGGVKLLNSAGRSEVASVPGVAHEPPAELSG